MKFWKKCFCLHFFIIVSKQHQKVLVNKKKTIVFYKYGGFFVNERMYKRHDDVKKTTDNRVFVTRGRTVYIGLYCI